MAVAEASRRVHEATKYVYMNARTFDAILTDSTLHGCHHTTVFAQRARLKLLFTREQCEFACSVSVCPVKLLKLPVMRISCQYTSLNSNAVALVLVLSL